MLYTCNFTFLGLNEAFAATGDEQYKRMADKLADFLVRIQVRSEKHAELDGGWFRAFDYSQWEYWGSNADSGWGAWSIETGWTQAWIPTVLAMRELNENLWDISAKSKVNKHFEHRPNDPVQAIMIPDYLWSGSFSPYSSHISFARATEFPVGTDTIFSSRRVIHLSSHSIISFVNFS